MNESILNSVKKLVGMSSVYDAFDTDIIIHINSVFMILNQLGVGPEKCFSITGSNETWSDFFGDGEDRNELNAVKTYIAMKVRLVFDAPTNSSLMEALKESIAEFEWRLNVQKENQNE